MAIEASVRSAVPDRPAVQLRSPLTVWWVTLALVLLGDAVLTLAGICGWTPVDTLDQKIDLLNLRHRWPEVHRFFLDYVLLGQRGPSTFVTLPIFLWLCRSRRSFRPLVMLITALVVLNVSVGVVKVATGRWGPLVTRQAQA